MVEGVLMVLMMVLAEETTTEYCCGDDNGGDILVRLVAHCRLSICELLA